MAACESGGNWSYGVAGHDDGDGFQGGPNFAPSTWDAYKNPGDPASAGAASKAEQIAVAKKVLRDQGVHAWPVCGPRAGLSMSDAN